MSAGILVFPPDCDRAQELSRRRFGGLTLLERGLRTMARAGVRQLVVVGVPAPSALSRFVQRLDLEVEFVDWNGPVNTNISAGDDFLVLLADHVHHHSSLNELVTEGRHGNGLVVQTSPPNSQETALFRVQTEEDVVRFNLDFGDELITGAFLCESELVPLDLICADVDPLTFLSVRAIGRRVELRPGDPKLWRRVSDRRTVREAKNMLFGQVTKKTSGPVSRHINARLSIPVSKLLIETGISPHMVTVLFVLTTGLTAAWLISFPEDPVRLTLAGVLWQMAAILDRCDGEIARVELCESKFGAWFDTLTDNLAYLSAYAGFLVGIDKLHPDQPIFLYSGFSAGVALIITTAVMYNYALRTGSGSLQNYLVGFSRHVPPEEKGWLYRNFESYAFMAKRDFFSFVYFLGAITGMFHVIYFYTVGGLHILALGVLISQRKMLESHRRHVTPMKQAPAHAANETPALPAGSDGKSRG
ncbi:MAG: CDP-alcohol phosphatidyltransferase family protein [Candidatus Latescibacterota bacterium]|nr:CDP-alcohol phosphatidyltransferase family protein [Candidatus Latescibacterota bacterium]